MSQKMSRAALPRHESMKIRKLRIRNIKLIRDQVFDFEHEGEPRAWTVLLGDNGVCKTSILQAIAIAASGDGITRALVPNAKEYGHVSFPKRQVTIIAKFDVPFYREMPSTMILEPASHDFIGLGLAEILRESRSMRAPGYFVVAYGVGRRLPRPGEVAIPSDPHKDRVSGLFDSHHKMLGIDYVDALQGELRDTFINELAAVLVHTLPGLSNDGSSHEEAVALMAEALRARKFSVSQPGSDVPLLLSPHQLSQGYQSTIAWVADLLGQAFVDQGAVAACDLGGIVLLDEIDLHLHPTWQRRVVPTLRAAFPNLQFIVTTHSPLVLTGFEAHEIIKLELENGEVVQRTFEIEPGLQNSNQLMESYFDVPVAGRDELLRLEEELLQIRTRKSNDPKRVSELEKKLRRYRRNGPVPLDEPELELTADQALELLEALAAKNEAKSGGKS